MSHGCGDSACIQSGTGCPESYPNSKAGSQGRGSPPPTRIEVVKIALQLAAACAISALVLGLVFVMTEPVKRRNHKMQETASIRDLMGLGNTAEITEVRRYLSRKDDQLEVVYLTSRSIVRLDESGHERATVQIPDSLKTGGNGDTERDNFVIKTLAAAGRSNAQYVGRFFVGRLQSVPVGYVIEGSTPGFKSQIRFFLALTRDFTVRGVEIVEHEEDPGLGAEIVQNYFKNQFLGRKDETITSLNVSREPMPRDWRLAVESSGELTYESWMTMHRTGLAKHPNIYAITGSTISSAAVTNGVKRAYANFISRMKTLEPYL